MHAALLIALFVVGATASWGNISDCHWADMNIKFDPFQCAKFGCMGLAGNGTNFPLHASATFQSLSDSEYLASVKVSKNPNCPFEDEDEWEDASLVYHYADLLKHDFTTVLISAASHLVCVMFEVCCDNRTSGCQIYVGSIVLERAP